MFKLLVILSVAAYCRAGTYSGFGLSNGYSGGSLGSTIGFNGKFESLFKNGLYSGNKLGTSGSYAATPIQSHRTVELRPVTSSHETPKDHLIEVAPDQSPVTIHFKTNAIPVIVQQSRTPGVVQEVEHTSSEDQPHRVMHEVVKPVIQEIHEIIQPYRRVVQQIQPVLEEVHTIVAKGEPRSYRGELRANSGEPRAYRGEPRANRAQATISSSNVNKADRYDYHLPEGTISSSNGVPVYRSIYKGPAPVKRPAYGYENIF